MATATTTTNDNNNNNNNGEKATSTLTTTVSDTGVPKATGTQEARVITRTTFESIVLSHMGFHMKARKYELPASFKGRICGARRKYTLEDFKRRPLPLVRNLTNASE